MDLKPLLLLVHVLAAFAYVAGYAGTNLLTELARRTEDPALRRSALHLSGRFDRLLNAPGGTLVGLTGFVVVPVFGYSFLTPWIALSIALFAVIIALGIVYWRRYGKGIEAALSSGDDPAVAALLREPRSVIVSRLENLVLLAIIVLMVLKPGS